MSLTTDEKIAHLLRRFGLGAGRREMEKYRPLGVDGTLQRLVGYDKVPDDFPVSIWEFHTDPTGKIGPSPQSTRAWWVMRMACTERPLEEKLTMFWHDHFAVSALKVPSTPEVDDYLFKLRANAAAPFRQALKEISYSPAMIRWLDSLGSYPAKPNENFGRELMELFTLGIGHYSEQDVRETARCFVGIGIQYATPPGTKTLDYYRQVALEGLPIVSVSFAPGFEDHRQKTIRGKTGPLTAEDVFTNLCQDPATAQRVLGKLWTFFVSEKPPAQADLDRLAAVWHKNDLQIRPVLLEMAKLDAFWSDATVRKLPKSPLDFTMSLARQVGTGPRILKHRDPKATPVDSIRKIAAPFYGLAGAMGNQGLSLLYPEDVSGWKWGSAWLTSAAMLARTKFVQQLFTTEWATDYLGEVMSAAKTANSEALATRIADDLDIPTNKDQLTILTKALDTMGGPPKAFANLAVARQSMSRVATLFVGIPDYHLG